MATDPAPIAVANEPVAMALKPTAVALVPVALAAPTAVAELHRAALLRFGPVDGELMGPALLEEQAGSVLRGDQESAAGS